MKNFKHKLIFFYLILITGFIFPSAVLPEASKKVLATVDKVSMVITSDTLEIDNKRKIVTFSGKVDARRDDFRINCEKMFLHYKDQPTDKRAGKSPGKMDVMIDKIIAKGKVKIIRTEGGLAMADEATYDQIQEKIILTGNPVVKQGNDFVEGSRITLFLKEQRSLVEGSENKRVKAVIFPRTEKR